MKALHYLLFALLVSQYLSQTQVCTKVRDPTKPEDCNKAAAELEGVKVYRCCYLAINATFQGRSDGSRICYPVTKAIYNKVDTLIDIVKDSADEVGAKITHLEVNCNSKYLVNSILLILLFLV